MRKAFPRGGRWPVGPDEGDPADAAHKWVAAVALPSSVRFADSFPRGESMRCTRRVTHKNNQQDTEHIGYTVTKIPKRFT